MKENMFKNVNWGKIAEKAGYAVAIIVAIGGAIADHDKERKFKQMEEDIAKLKEGKS